MTDSKKKPFLLRLEQEEYDGLFKKKNVVKIDMTTYIRDLIRKDLGLPTL